MSDKFFVGLDLTGLEDNGRQKPISRVTLRLDDENVLTAGDDTGRELVADCPHATQAMVDSILASVRGYRYQMMSADDANLDPAAELGDGVTAGGIYATISRIADDESGYSGVSAPGEAELEDEYPSAGPMTQEFNRKISETRSRITKTAEQIRLEVENELAGLSASIDVKLDGITQRVDGLDGSYSALSQKVDSFTLEVSDQLAGLSAFIDVKLDGITQRVKNTETGLSQTLRVAPDGITITNAQGSTLTIDGGQIDASKIHAEDLVLTGAISWSDLDGDTQGQINAATTGSSNAFDTASSALDTANSLANGTGGGTFINGTTVNSPTIVGGLVTGALIHFGANGNSGFLRSGFGHNGETYTEIIELSATQGLVLRANSGMRINCYKLWIDVDIYSVHFIRNGAWVSLGSLLQEIVSMIPQG